MEFIFLTEQASSVVTTTEQGCYTNETGCFSVYGFEYQPGFDNAYISWIANNELAWTAMQGGFAADPRVNISARPVPQEPMVRLLGIPYELLRRWFFSTSL